MNIDPDYLEGIKNGDRTVLAALYRDMAPAILRLAASVGLTREDSRDVFQDAVLVVFEKAAQPEFRLTSSFRTYFYGICRNLIGNLLKKRSGREVTIPEDAKYREDGDTDMLRQMEDAERHRLFHQALRQLGDDCQRLLELSFEDREPQDIMRTMNIDSYDYFRRRKYLCKEKLVQLVRNNPLFRELKTNSPEPNG